MCRLFKSISTLIVILGIFGQDKAWPAWICGGSVGKTPEGTPAASYSSKQSLVLNPRYVGTTLKTNHDSSFVFNSRSGHPRASGAYFFLSTRQANTVYTRVCKEWSDVALDVLWWEINNPSHLIRLLCPLHPEPDGDGGVIWSFDKEQGDIQTTDWERLRSYVKRVRILVVPRRIPILDDSVFAEIQSAGRFLPNLQRLEWYPDAFYYPLFTNKNVSHLTLRLDSEDTKHSSQVILDIPKYLPLLTSLTLELPDYYAISTWIC